MRRFRYLGVTCGLGLVVLLCVSAGLAAAPASQDVAAPVQAPAPAAAAPSAPPVDWSLAEPARSGAKTALTNPAGRQEVGPRSVEEFIASLRGEEPVPASSCHIATDCRCGGVVSCSGSTCSKGVGCWVVCDGVEYDCHGCSGHYCA